MHLSILLQISWWYTPVSHYENRLRADKVIAVIKVVAILWLWRKMEKTRVWRKLNSKG